ncbi:hypothetical protein [Azotosporobacter soli]|uniref:hypothetical protein n=1 Tax=Azotosporobacter soli TaxID=3055040 RepID=UPI0031FF26EC
MSGMKSVLGYLAAVASLVVALATFFGMNLFSHRLVDATGLTIAPGYSGGEIVRTIARDGYEIRQHRMVFDGLLTERSEGFVQIDFAPPGALPPLIEIPIELDLDGKTSFELRYDVQKNQAQLTSDDKRVVGVKDCYILKERRAVRIELKK